MKLRDATQIIGMLENGKLNADLSDDIAKTLATLLEMSEQSEGHTFKGKTVITLNFAVKDGATIIGAKFESTTPDRPRRNTMLFNLEDGTLSTEHPRQSDMFSPRAVSTDGERISS